MKLTIYSPAPPPTRLHELNVELATMLRAAGIDADIVPLALPDSINYLAGLPPADRAMRLPIVTVADLVPAIEQTGPDWHAYQRPCPELALLASLYDVALGVTVRDGVADSPPELAGRRIHAPPRPSSVRLLTEALVEIGWDLAGRVAYADSTPLDLGAAIGRGELVATSWNLTTLEGGRTSPHIRLRNSRYLAVDDATLARLNEHLHFQIGTCEVGDVPLLAFRQGIAAWPETPREVAEAILSVLQDRRGGPFFADPAAMAHWPGLADANRHPALLGRVGQSGRAQRSGSPKVM